MKLSEISDAAAPESPKKLSQVTGGGPDKVWYNDAGQAVSATTNLPVEQKGEPYTGSIIPLRRDEKGLHLAVPEAIASPARGIVEGGKRASGHEEAGKDPLRPLSPDTIAAAMSVGGVRPPARVGLPETPKSPVMAQGVRPPAFEARQAGYVLPPAAISEKPGLISNVLAGWGGKIKTQQAASARNQEVTNELAAQALGLPKGTVLSDQVFSAIRDRAGQAYQAVKESVPVINADAAYDSIVDGLGGSNSHAAQLFPKITKNPGIKDLVDELKSVREIPTEAAVEIVKELRFNGNSNLKAIGDPSKHALGIAQRQAADAIDNLMERNIEAAGNLGIVDAYRQARQLIAKSYDVEGATNIATGDVNARGLAKLAAKGRPLSGELDTIANAASAFPKAMQPPAGFGYDESYSALDFFGSAAAALHGHPTVAGVILGRPLARGAMLSKPFQNAVTNERPSVGVSPYRAVPGATVGDQRSPMFYSSPENSALGVQ